MAHFDAIGYGDLRRTAFMVEVEWALSSFGSQLGERPRGLLTEFITTFRKHRVREAAKADLVLSIFHQCDVRTAEGHKQILMRWIALEELGRYVALGRYTSFEGRSWSA
jgi:hypothetical protein